MADKIHFDLVSPERMLMSEDVDMVTLPGVEPRHLAIVQLHLGHRQPLDRLTLIRQKPFERRRSRIRLARL
jgi:hypothetical protein